MILKEGVKNTVAIAGCLSSIILDLNDVYNVMAESISLVLCNFKKISLGYLIYN